MIQSEKRKYIRLNAEIRVVIIPYEVTENDLLIGRESQTKTQNIGAGGILLRSDTALPVGSLVEIRIFLPGENRPIEAIGEIRHLRRLKQSPSFDIGVLFLKINLLDKKKLLRLKKIH